MLKMLIFGVTVGLAVLTASACDDNEPRGLIARLALNDGRTTFKPGEPIHMTLTITKYTGKPIRITYPDNRRYDFDVYRPTSWDTAEPVWLWSTENQYPEAPKEQDWQPGETVTYVSTWTQTDYRGGSAVPGEYIAGARNPACHTGVDFHCDTTARAPFEIAP